jgi:hypothetical protein
MKRMLSIIIRILNADPEFGSPLTEQQIREFLLNSKLDIHIGTVDEKDIQIFIPHGIITILQIISYMFMHQNILKRFSI